MPSYQIPLQIRLNDNATFDNYLVAGNAQAIDLLSSDERYIYLWSAEATGKTHLLQALCHQHTSSFYLPLTDIDAWQTDILEGLEQFALVCIDDVHQIAGRSEWETALFDLFNRLQENSRRLVVTANCSPAGLDLQLADLSSRLAWGVSLQLNSLTDEQKIQALRQRAQRRGFQFPDEAAAYLLKHCPRDLHSLFAILDRLDDASLQAQRRISIPFIKQALANNSG